MSSSDEKTLRREALRYLLAALFCVVFSAVYEHFSHGVYSEYMLFLFAFPLVGGAFPALALSLSAVRFPAQRVRNLWGSAVATLGVGSCLTGVMEIYGSTSRLIIYYWLVGALLAAAAVLLYIFGGKLAQNNS